MKIKTPLLGFTVLQIFILFMIVNVGTAAIIINRNQSSRDIQDQSTYLASNGTEHDKATQVPSKNQKSADDKSVTTNDVPTNVPPKESASSTATRCKKLHYELLSEDIDNFQRDIEFLRKNLAMVDKNADLLSEKENNKLRNKYIKFYNDNRKGSINVYRQTMINNGCSEYIKEPKPGYVEYY